MARIAIKKDIHKQHFETACQYLPGGVNSPVRSFKAVGGDPVFVRQAQGSKMDALDGRKFIDYCLSWGALILGHAHEEVVRALEQAVRKGTSFGMPTSLETELAKRIVEAIPSVERIRLTNSGTEAVMGAVRVARAYTKKNKIIKFEGSYHGHPDYLLVKAGSGASTLGIPDSLGVPEDFTRHTIVLPYNDLEKTDRALREYGEDIAAIIVEPVAGNMGVVLPQEGFLQGLRKMCDAHRALLIFDEVITGFRLCYGGAQNYFEVQPDMTCLGKIIGGGLPMGAFGGREDIMKFLAPLGGVYQAGTLSGNPIAVTAGLVTLKLLARENPYSGLESMTQKLCSGIREAAHDLGLPIHINTIGSMFTMFFTNQEVTDYWGAAAQDALLFRRFYHELLRCKIYFAPSPFEANFLSTAHTEHDLEQTLRGVRTALEKSR